MSFLFRTVTLLGAMASFALVLYVGRNNNSLVLLMLFGIWVPAPLIAIFALHRISQSWSADARAVLEIAGFIITVVPLIVYANVAFGPPRPRPAGMFLVVPAFSWI